MREIRRALLMFLMLILIIGVLYARIVTGISGVAFPSEAGSSLIQGGNEIVGSVQIDQSFSDPEYFWRQPSATWPQPDDAAASNGSNQDPTDPALGDVVKGRVEALLDANPGNSFQPLVDLVSASGGDLDPHVTRAAAGYQVQVARVARARGLPVDEVRELVATYTEGRQWWLLGEPRVNVPLLNLALDKRR